jgi:Protein of unknown function (DUF4238)
MPEPLRRRNHWVPAFYLGAFTTRGRRDDPLVIYDREQRDKVLRIPPHAIALERDLYVVMHPEQGVLTDEIERFLATDVEGPFVSVRNHLAFGVANGLTGKLSRDEEGVLATFLAFQQVRTPAFRERMEMMTGWAGAMFAHTFSSNPEAVQRAGIATRNKRPSRAFVRSIRRALEQEHIVVEPSEKAWLQFALKQVPELISIIKSLPRRVFYAPSGIEVPTSDSPLVIVRRTDQAHYTHGGGWVEPNVEVILPLSPSSVLVLGSALTLFDDHGSPEWWAQVRQRIATGAHRWLFSNTEDQELRELLYASSAPELVLEYPGGVLRRGESPMAAVLDMKRRNPGEAIIRFGPPQ